jgi:hypothetical protein
VTCPKSWRRRVACAPPRPARRVARVQAALPRRRSDPAGTARKQVTQHRMQLIDQPGPLRDHIAAALVEQRQHGRGIFGHNRAGIALQRGHGRCRSRVDNVVLTPAAVGQPRASGRSPSTAHPRHAYPARPRAPNPGLANGVKNQSRGLSGTLAAADRRASRHPFTHGPSIERGQSDMTGSSAHG